MEKKHRIISADNKLEFGINKLLSMLMLAACLVFVLIETRDARYSNALFLVLIFAAAAVVIIPWGRLSRRISEKAGREIQLNVAALRLMFVLTPFVAYWLTVKVTGYKTSVIISELFSVNGFLNMFIITLVLLIFYAVFNTTKLAVVLTTVLAMVLAMVDYIMLLFRGTPLIAEDIASAGTGMDVVANYTMEFNKASIWIITVTVIYISTAVAFRSYKGLAGKKRLALILCTAVYTASFAGLFYISDFIEENGYSISGYRPDLRYEEYGTALAFVVSTTDAAAEAPEGYTPDKVKKIAERYEPDKAVKTRKSSEKTPDLIVIMNESYSDLGALGEFDVSGDCMPFFRSLKNNTVKGVLHTSVLGGGTATTEHEFLTGSTSAFFPLHKVMYNDLNDGSWPSLASSLKELGYHGSIAFHPGKTDSYNRDNAYPALGFDKLIFAEDMNGPEMVRDYISYQADYECVISEYERYKGSGDKAPFFMFNVTIQNHGGYTEAAGKVEKEIRLTDTEAYDEEAQQYLNLIKKSDEALKYLISYFRKADDPVVIVMFGDHQPRVGDSFYSAMERRMPAEDSPLEKEERKYQVPFMIWSNYDIDERTGDEMSVSFFSSYVKKKLGLPLNRYDKFLMDTYRKLPVVSDICFIDKDGNRRLYGGKSEYRDVLDDYRMVEYNCVTDTENRVESFFSYQ